MIRLTLKRTTDGEGYTVSVEGCEGLFSVDDPWVESVNGLVPPWRLYVLQYGREKYAASLTHGLELGVAAVARWLAIELLKNPSEPAAGESVGGCRLWMAGPYLMRSFTDWSMRVEQHEDHWDAHGIGSRVIPGEFACQEQAIAALIEHAAPWIALELAKEVQS
jgi:hypothetical protein